MKKFLTISVWAMAAAALLGCSKENIESGDNDGSGNEGSAVPSYSVINASAANAAPESKTTLSGSSILWAEGDRISLFNEDGQACGYYLSSEPGQKTGRFTADETSSVAGGGYGYAVYPEITGSTVSLNAVPFYVSTLQTYTGNGFAAGYPMYAVSEDHMNFSFRNLASVISLHLTGNATLKSITIEAVNGEKIAGNAAADLSAETPVLVPADDASGSLTLDMKAAPVTLSDEPVTFNIFLFPGEYQQLKFTFTETNNSSSSRTSSDLSLKAGYIKDFADLDIHTPQGWNITGSFGDMNWGSSWIDMKDAHGLIYAEGLEVPDGGLFKIRYAGSEWYGGQVDNTPGVEALCTIVPNSQMENITHINTDTRTSANMTIAEGKYNIYFDYWAFGGDNERYHYLWAMTEGTPFGVVGNCTGSDWGKNIPMVIKNGWLMAEGVEFAEQGAFKIRFGETWDAIFELGSDAETLREIGSPVTVIRKNSGYQPQNIVVPAGTYDIYLDFNRVENDQYRQTVWIMPQGEVPGEN